MSPGWAEMVERLKEQLGEETVARWIAPLKPTTTSDSSIILEAPNAFFRDWVVAHYQGHLQQLVGHRQVKIVLAQASSHGTAPSKGVQAPEPSVRPDRGLNPRFTFEQFVVGPSNRFAHAASLAVAESPAKAYNPLFIYGGVGLGKTHLMQAIGHAITGRSRSSRVCYMSSEQFTNELISAIQSRTTARFRERYRTVDILLIDDVHFIAGKESTQEEFFHTFNTLYDSHRQIVVSSDQPPKDIAGLEERLVSRFEWGLVTDIQAPDLETRIAILRKKAEDVAIAIPEEVTEFIAKQITSNIRELEGALIRVVAYGRFFSKGISLPVVQEVLKDFVREVGARITIPVIQQRVGEHFHLSPEELSSVKRHRSVVYPRHVAMYLCRVLTDSSLPEIGRAFGGRDHSTVLHAIGKIEQELAQDEHKKRLINQLTQSITTSTTTG